MLEEGNGNTNLAVAESASTEIDHSTPTTNVYDVVGFLVRIVLFLSPQSSWCFRGIYLKKICC